MSKKGWFFVILAALIVNVVSLQFTIEAFYGREDHVVTRQTIISIICVVITLIAYFQWKRLEYKK
ncbi:hypothetical protein [Ectobacillus panaciterrae]|uniref:hypothetical protein n=1 Tax=Ectobacillus panaciterrae TaxID=363872 RepID=UPI00040FEB8C|nr:hypothetical protein [Ectobacillus panaciterrae]